MVGSPRTVSYSNKGLKSGNFIKDMPDVNQAFSLEQPNGAQWGIKPYKSETQPLLIVLFKPRQKSGTQESIFSERGNWKQRNFLREQSHWRKKTSLKVGTINQIKMVSRVINPASSEDRQGTLDCRTDERR